MGGQACVFYGAAEFSRDTDLALLASEQNIELLRTALRELRATRIALPPFRIEHLRRGHAVHFRSHHPDALRMRIDVMSVMRGVEAFENLWNRRTTATGIAEVLSLPDLVVAKKTQRTKDWDMIRRLIEADYVRSEHPTDPQSNFWLLESRTPEMLVALSQRDPARASALADRRPLLRHAAASEVRALCLALDQEQQAEMDRDREYWLPLRAELESLRHSGIAPEEPV